MLRLGAVSYLNTKPLIEALPEWIAGAGNGVEKADVDPRAGDAETERWSLRLDLPSRLAADLAAGRLDVALIPSIEYFRGDPGYQIVSDAAIACRGPVWSVRLLSRVPADQIGTLALDEGSRTSAAMVQVLLSEIHGLRPQTVPFPIDTAVERCDADAVLMIGDRAMHPSRGVYSEIWDLGDRWCRWTELPFVFAMWVARPEVAGNAELMERLSTVLGRARDVGVRRFEAIASRESGGQGLTKEDLHRYFAENLHFTLGAGERNGLAAFEEKARRLGLVPGPSGAGQDRFVSVSV